MAQFIKTSVDTVRSYKKPILITTGIVLFIAIAISASSFAYARAYQGRILPNVFIGIADVGELSEADATEVLQQHVDDMLNNGVDVTVDGQSGHIDLRASIIEEPDLAHDLIYIDTADAIEVAMAVGRTDSIWTNLTTPIKLLIEPTVLLRPSEIDEDDIREQLTQQFGELETQSLPADYRVNLNDAEAPVKFMPGKDGTEIDYESAIAALWDDANDLELEDITINLRDITYEMTSDDALSISDEVIEIVEAAPYYLTYTSETLREYWWTVDADEISDWIEPAYSKDGDVIIVFAGGTYEAFVEDVTDDVNISPVNARFVMEDNIVTEFSGSQDGIELDSKTTMQELFDELGQEDVVIDITVANTPPDVSTADVNNFGISEIIGVGISDFSGSPSNRISNIQHGASKLDGLLIAPGETISLVGMLGPFTVSDGYLAELVIKGDEIIPEVGGGLCQIGTTAFRAVMNSGLQIDQRQNHSLVVSYYNDPSNGNPGTDATIYDPYPDFKFTNDYEDYILLNTEVDLATLDVIFTFWGTNDGRNGYYSPPVILSWAGYGETEYTETLDLDPGVTSCQSPHPGATAQFTYYVDYADETQFSETYTSVYRSLPMICLIGVEELTVECAEGEECESIDESETSDDDDDIEMIEEDLTEEAGEE
ncbi:hypothetical protein HN358_04310 [Candidatus Uhrbacteria bacterium]|jgi:vancomycin resistance protein YoaR|nr:hypothetical protein [Candidatus Uhrbacteria bacterium]MBT7717007.1 hypothetical protein [Candidatus Uhrbacteria bacterium]